MLLGAIRLVFLLCPIFVDYATFESALSGLFFAVLLSAVYGYSEGDRAVRDWRYEQRDE